MKRPADLTREELIDIVDTMQRLLYLSIVDDDADVLTAHWTPHKVWCGTDVCDVMATTLNNYGLCPDHDTPMPDA